MRRKNYWFLSEKQYETLQNIFAVVLGIAILLGLCRFIYSLF